MTNRNIESVGVRAVFENLQGYLSAHKQAEAANLRLAQAQKTLEAATISASSRQRSSAQAIENAQRNLAIVTRTATLAVTTAQTRLAAVTDTVSRRIVEGEFRVEAARQRMAATTNASAKIQETALARLAAAERALENIQVSGAARIAAAQQAVAAAQTTRVERVAAAQATLAAAQSRASEVAVASSLAIQRANLGAVAAGGKYAATGTLMTTVLGGFSTAQKLASQAVTTFGKILIAVTGFANRFAVSLRFGIAAVAAFTAAFALAATTGFENTLAKIDNLTELTTADTDKLGQSLIAMSRAIPKSPAELGATAYEALSRGITDVNQALDITELAAKTAVAAQTDAKEVIIAVTGVINAYGKENITATQAAEILFATVKAGGGEFTDYAQNIGRVAQLSRDLGVTFNQVGAAMATLTNVGIPANQATTALLGILNQIASPSKEAEEALAGIIDPVTGLSFSIQQLRANIRDKGLIPALQDLIHLFGGQRQILEDLFPEVRGYSGALALLGTANTEFARTQATVNNSVGIIEQAFKRQSQTFSFQAGLLKNELTRSLLELGTAALPTVTRAVQDLRVWWQRNGESVVEFIKDIVQLGSILARGFLSTLQTVVRFLTLVNNAFKSITGISPATVTAVLAIGAAFAWALPGGPVILGLTAIVTALGLLAKSTDLQIGLAGQEKLLEAKAKFTAELEKPGIPSAIRKDLEDALRKIDERLKSFSATEEQTAQETQLLEQQMKALDSAFQDSGNASDLLKEKIKDLTEDFQRSSEAARSVEDIAASLGLFGEISQELAQALDISAETAGTIQGFDAVAAASSRAGSAAFIFAKTLSTVAAAFQQSAAVAQRIVAQLARTALQAAQAAAQAIFAQPTREVADLNLQLAQRQLTGARQAAQANPQLNSLNQQLNAINQAIQNAQRSAQQSSQRASQQFSEISNKALNIAQRQLDALKLANTKAEVAYERQQAQLDKLIDATKERASKLQEAFLKANESLQRQINEAIGRGDTQTALELVDQQRAAAKAYQAEAENLEDTEQELTKQQKALQAEEEERRRVVRLLEAEIQFRIDGFQAQKRAIESQNRHTESIEADTSALEQQKAAIEEQIAAITAQTEAQANSEQQIQDQIDILQAQKNLYEAQITAANQALLTEAQQRQAIEELIPMIRDSSQLFRDLTIATGESLIPEFTKAKETFDLVKEAARVLTEEGFQKTLIDQGINPAQSGLEAIGDLAKRAADNITALGDASNRGAQNIVNATQNALNVTTVGLTAAQRVWDSVISGINNFFNKLPSPTGRAEGGIFSRPTLTWVAETRQKEAIIPLERPQRARQIMASISPATLASILPAQSSQNVFAPQINVSGETLETMRTYTLRAVDQAFRKASIASGRSGGFISQGLGPSR